MVYDAAPSRRFATDSDGTIGFFVLTAEYGYETIGSADMSVMADESEVGTGEFGSLGEAWVGYLFPEDREIDGIFVAYGSGGYYKPTPSVVQTSVDTTNGVDGTWVQQVADIDDYTVVATNWRNEITSMAVSGVRGIRVKFSAQANATAVRAFHVYGTITTGETPDRLVFLDTTDSDAVFSLPIDYADVSQGQAQTRSIKVKNNSATYAFTSVQITAEDLHGAIGDDLSFCLTVDGTYQSTLQISASLAAGAEVTVYVKNTTPDAETPGLWAGRIKLTFGTMV